MSPAESHTPNRDQLLDLHRRMVRIRHFEEEAGKLTEAGKIPGALHLYVGEEAVAAGVMVHLSNDDQITWTHRGPRPPHRQGRRLPTDVRRAVRQGDRLLPGQGRQHAHLGPRARHARRERHRRRQRPHRRRRRVREQVPQERPRHGLLLRRRRVERRRVSRSGEHGGALQAAGRVRLREQPLRRVHRPGAPPGDRRRRRSCRPATACRASSSTAWTRSRSSTPPASAIARARGGEGPSLLECKTYRFYDHVGVTGMRIPYRDRRRGRRLEGARSDRRVRAAPGRSSACSTPTRSPPVHRRACSTRSPTRSRSPRTSPLPDVAALLDDVYSNPIVIRDARS